MIPHRLVAIAFALFGVLPVSAQAEQWVFVTRETVQGDIDGGGVGAADAICQAEADAPGSLAPPSTYLAWLSTGTQSAAQRFAGSPGPFVRPDGATTVTIANDLADLLSGTLNITIAKHADGGPVGGIIWTGTSPTGTTSDNCLDWTSASGAENAAFGNANLSSSSWTDQPGTRNCNEYGSLYCFQVPTAEPLPSSSSISLVVLAMLFSLSILALEAWRRGRIRA